MKSDHASTCIGAEAVLQAAILPDIPNMTIVAFTRTVPAQIWIGILSNFARRVAANSLVSDIGCPRIRLFLADGALVSQSCDYHIPSHCFSIADCFFSVLLFWSKTSPMLALVVMFLRRVSVPLKTAVQDAV